MPTVVVNMSSMVARAVIYLLCTLELTIERHFCSILEHRLRPRYGVAGQRRDGVEREECAPLRAWAGFHQSQSENYEAANIAISTRMPFNY
jgi:hypothetical protein